MCRQMKKAICLNIKLYYDLLDIIEKQENVIKKQNETIIKITNENLEKENMINELMKQEEYLF